MATTSRIGFIAQEDGILNYNGTNVSYKKGNYVSCYVHFDGYPELLGVGDYLRRYVKTQEDIVNILQLGNMSSMCVELGTILYYVRDFKETPEKNSPKVSERPEIDTNYLYKFENGQWLCTRNCVTFENINSFE